MKWNKLFSQAVRKNKNFPGWTQAFREMKITFFHLISTLTGFLVGSVIQMRTGNFSCLLSSHTHQKNTQKHCVTHPNKLPQSYEKFIVRLQFRRRNYRPYPSDRRSWRVRTLLSSALALLSIKTKRNTELRPVLKIIFNWKVLPDQLDNKTVFDLLV